MYEAKPAVAYAPQVKRRRPLGGEAGARMTDRDREARFLTWLTERFWPLFQCHLT